MKRTTIRRWTFLPLKRFYQLLPQLDRPETAAAVCVSSYPVSEERLCGVLHICRSFSDLTNERAPDAMTEADAEAIASFLDGLPPEIQTVFFCCDGGESRSAAMAAAYLYAHGVRDWPIWNDPAAHPNALVFRRLCTAWSRRPRKSSVALRLWVNRRALRVRIRRARKGK